MSQILLNLEIEGADQEVLGRLATLTGAKRLAPNRDVATVLEVMVSGAALAKTLLEIWKIARELRTSQPGTAAPKIQLASEKGDVINVSEIAEDELDRVAARLLSS